MQLTPAQRQLLTAYCDFRRAGVSTSALYRKSWRGKLLLALYFGAGMAFCLSYGLLWQAALLLGLALGLFLRDSFYVRRTVALWPVVADITDWGRVERLLQATEGEWGRA